MGQRGQKYYNNNPNSSHHGLSYFHLNDVLIDVISIILTWHTVIDVILTQVVLAEKQMHTQIWRAVKPGNDLNLWSLIIHFNKPILTHYDRWKSLSSQSRFNSLSDIAGSHKKPQRPMSANLCWVIEWHSLWMCLYFFCTQQASWPLIRQAASREETVTVENFSWRDYVSCRGSHCFSPTSGRTIIVGGGSDCEETFMPIDIEFWGLHLDKPEKLIVTFRIAPQQIQWLWIL